MRCRNIFSGNHVEWTYNLERAPWWGGVFERMVGLMKKCLKKIVGQAVLTQDELLTTITEVEAILNSRPISYISTEDIEEPLTPSHLIIGRRICNLPDITESSDDADFNPKLSTEQLSQRARYLKTVLDNFWRRWRMEYLLELRETHRYANTRVAQNKVIAVGDIVLVYESSLPRTFWRLAKVEKLIKGTDGEIRGAFIRVKSRNSSTVWKRPIQHLYYLESYQLEDKDKDEIAELEQPQPAHTRPRRIAAEVARKKIELLIEDSEN